jgi:hypothetical protein
LTPAVINPRATALETVLTVCYTPIVMTNRSMEYCVNVVNDEASHTVQMFLDTSQSDMQWTNVSKSSGVVTWDSFFLNSLIVNPSAFLEIDVPDEWSRVVLLALCRGSELNDKYKSIWYSTLNTTAFVIIAPSVRLAVQNHIQSLQLRASKSKRIFSSNEQGGILPVKTEVVQFEPRRKCETMAKFLNMADKVRCTIISLKRYTLL